MFNEEIKLIKEIVEESEKNYPADQARIGLAIAMAAAIDYEVDHKVLASLNDEELELVANELWMRPEFLQYVANR